MYVERRADNALATILMQIYHYPYCSKQGREIGWSGCLFGGLDHWLTGFHLYFSTVSALNQPTCHQIGEGPFILYLMHFCSEGHLYFPIAVIFNLREFAVIPILYYLDLKSNAPNRAFSTAESESNSRNTLSSRLSASAFCHVHEF